MEEGSIYDKLKEMLKDSKGTFSILEEQIDVDLQVDFFNLIKKVSENKRDFEDIISDEKMLYDKSVSLDDKKQILVELSNLEKPEAYRIIEKFIGTDNKELKSWAILSLQHCRISLETHLLDEEQVFISTGLGGSGDKLRYFIAGKRCESNEFTDSQKKIIKNEFELFFNNNNSVVEKVEFLNKYYTITGLIPIENDLKKVISPAIKEINQYGDFIYKEYLITNVKVLSESEIENYFNKKEID